MKKFNEKYGPWALVTGATSGIGHEISMQLAEKGLNVIAVARSEENLAALKLRLESKYAVNVETISQDLSNPESSKNINERTAHLDVGLLVANAGIDGMGSFIDKSQSSEENLLALNVVSPMQLSHVFSKRFAQRGKGGVLLTSSVFGYQGIPHFANYSASKAYILSLGEALNVELKPLGIDVTVLSPGVTKTSMVDNMPINFRKMPVIVQAPEVVAKVGLNALGVKATVVPGLLNKVFVWENRLIPRTWPVKMFGFLIKRASTVKLKSFKQV